MKKEAILLALHTASSILDSIAKIILVVSDDPKIKGASTILEDTAKTIDDIITEIELIENLQ